MTEHAPIPAPDAPRRSAPRRARAKRRPPRHLYFAFLSYSHKDEELADWLHRELEDFKVPSGLVGKITEHGVIPRRLTPIFRDEQELAAADDLSSEIEQALAGSQYLIVLCSPNSAASRWTNAEIESFKRRRPDGCVLAAIAAGEPFASDIEGRGDQECFPPALRQKYDRLGRPTGKRAEPLAADLRSDGDGRRLGFLKLVAGMLGVGLDDLVQRETTRRQRRLAWLTSASIAGMALTSLLAFAAIQARDEARDQRREAEGLVAFMLGDLKDKLEPIGRLDALDGVGAKVLDYYRRQDAKDLPDDALVQRSRALSLSAQVAYSRGTFNTAERLYREAFAGTAEAVQRDPDHAQHLFDHAQNAYWLGDIAMQRGDAASAERAFRLYKQLAERMIAIDPNDMKWRMESQYAETNLGIVLFNQRRYPDAARAFAKALGIVGALAAADPDNDDYQINHLEALAWYAQAQQNTGRQAEAAAVRERHIAMAKSYLAANPGDVGFRQRLIPSFRTLANIRAAMRDGPGAMRAYEEAIAIGKSLMAEESGNSRWVDYTAKTQLNFANFLIDSGRLGDAAVQANSGCRAYSAILAKDPGAVTIKQGLIECSLTKARLALAQGDGAAARAAADRAARIARSTVSPDRAVDSFNLAIAQRLIGDSERRLGRTVEAGAAYRAALAALPNTPMDTPDESYERARILDRAGRRAEAAPIIARLRSIGFAKTITTS